jgi:integrase
MGTITQTGPASFRVQIRRKDHKPITRTFRTRPEAVRFERATEAEIDAGRAPVIAAGTTVGEAIQAYRELRDESPRPIKGQSNEHYMLSHLTAALGEEPVSALTPKRLAAWARTRREEGAGGYTIGMELSKLGTALRYASVTLRAPLADVVTAARPMLEHFQLVGPGTERDRRLLDGEEARLLAVCPQWFGDVLRFALATALRRGEIVRLQWADLDAKTRTVLVRDRKDPRRKVGNHQRIPLLNLAGHDAWAIVQRQPRVGDRIFPYTPELLSDTFAVVRQLAGCDDLVLHDMRHEATSRLFAAGYGIEEVALVTGHKNWRMLARYTQVKPESLHRAPPAASDPDSRPRTDSPPSVGRRRGKSGSGSDPR